MSLGLSLNHLSASGNHTENVITSSGEAPAAGALYVSGAAAFGVPETVGGEIDFTWPGADTTFFVSGAVAPDASATSFGTIGDYDIAVFGGNLQISGTINVAGSIRGGLEAKDASSNAATPVSQQVAFWTTNLFLSGTENLRWDDNDLVINGNLQVQGTGSTVVSSSNFVVQDSVLGLGFSGSDTFNNVGQRSLLFGKGSAGGLLPGLTWDGTRAYTIGVPASPSSGTVDTSLNASPSNSGGIYIPAYESGELRNASQIQSVYGAGSFARALVFPVVDGGTVYYPGISGSNNFEIDDGTKLSTLFTDKLHHPGSDSFWNFDSTHAFRAKGTQGGSYDEVSGQWRFSHNTSVSYGGGTISAYPGGLKLNAQNGIQLSGSNGHVEVTTNQVRSNYDNQGPLGQAQVAWSDLFLANGAELHMNSDASSGIEIVHSTGQFAISGSWDSTAAEDSYGSFSAFTNGSGGGDGTLFDGPSTVSTSTTSLTRSSNFDATDVSELQSGNVIKFDGGGYGPAYFLITATPSVGDSSVSVEARNSFSNFGVGDAYNHTFTTTYTPGTIWTLGVEGTAWRTLYADNVDLNGNQTTGSFILDADRDTAIGTSADDVIDWFVGGIATSKFYMNASGIYPQADNSYDLGKADKRYRNIFTGDVNLQNDRGDWTLIEEDDFISFRNNMTGRRFRMVMEDITGMGNYGPGNDGEM